MDVVIDSPQIRAQLIAYGSQVKTPDLSDVMVSVENILLDEICFHLTLFLKDLKGEFV